MLEVSKTSLDHLEDYLKSKKLDSLVDLLLESGLRTVTIAFSLKNNSLIAIKKDVENKDIIFQTNVTLPVDKIYMLEPVKNQELMYLKTCYEQSIEDELNHCVSKKEENFIMELFFDDDNFVNFCNSNYNNSIIIKDDCFYSETIINKSDFEIDCSNNKIRSDVFLEEINFDRKKYRKVIKENIKDSFFEQVSKINNLLLSDNINELCELINKKTIDKSILSNNQIIDLFLIDKLIIDIPKESINELIYNNENIFMKLTCLDDVKNSKVNDILEYLSDINNITLYKQGLNFIDNFIETVSIKDFIVMSKGYNKPITNYKSVINHIIDVNVDRFNKYPKNLDLLKRFISKYSKASAVNKDFNSIFVDNYLDLLENTSTELSLKNIDLDQILDYICSDSDFNYESILLDINAIQYIDLYKNNSDFIYTNNNFLIKRKVFNELLELDKSYDFLIKLSNCDYQSKDSIKLASKAIKDVIKYMNVIKKETN